MNKDIAKTHMRLAVFLVSVSLLLSAGCRKRHEDGSQAQVGSMPGSGGATTIHQYSGTIDATPVPVTACVGPCRQRITVVGDGANFPHDQITIYLCRNANCAAAIPAAQCVTVWNQPATPCYTTSPNPHITTGSNYVEFIDANIPYYLDAAKTIQVPAYSTYAIYTTVTR